MLVSFKGFVPKVSAEACIMPGARLIGDVEIGPQSSVWYGAVLRADVASIKVGKSSNIQDNAVVHADENSTVRVGDYVTVGHSAVLHGCTIEDGALIGMGATVLDGAVIGKGSVVAAGCVVTRNTIVPPNSLVLGIPGKIAKTLSEEAFQEGVEHARRYALLGEAHKRSLDRA